MGYSVRLRALLALHNSSLQVSEGLLHSLGAFCSIESSQKSQEKCIEYIHCFYDVNEMVYIIITIVNIQLILYHVFFS